MHFPQLQGPGELLVDAVSLFPAENVREGALNPWPFREDLLDMLKALNPRWVLLSKGRPVYVPHAAPCQTKNATLGTQLVCRLWGPSLLPAME